MNGISGVSMDELTRLYQAVVDPSLVSKEVNDILKQKAKV